MQNKKITDNTNKDLCRSLLLFEKPKRYTLVFFLFFLLAIIFMPNTAAAATDSPFHQAPESYFINVILKGILGDVVNANAESAAGVMSGPGTLGEIFRTFNLGVAFFGSLIVVFITVVGVLQSGNDGEFLGRKWSSMWVPIRFATGSALMLPLSASGYSYCQAMVLWIASQGVMFADTLWETVVANLMIKNGVELTKALDVTSIVRTVAVSEVCSAVVNATSQSIASESGTSAPEGLFLRVLDIPANMVNGGVRNIKWDWTQRKQIFSSSSKTSTCGSLSYSVNTSLSPATDPYASVRTAMADLHVKLISNMAENSFRPLALKIAEKYAQSNGQGGESTYMPTEELLKMVTLIQEESDKYNAQMSVTITKELANSGYVTQTTPNSGDLTRNGFSMAGMWYVELLKAHNTARNALNVPEMGISNLESIGLGPSMVRVVDAMAEVNKVISMSSENSGGYTSSPSNGIAGGSATIKTTTTHFKLSTSDIVSRGFLNGFMVSVTSWLQESLFGVGQKSDGSVNKNIPVLPRNPNVSTILQLKDKGDMILDASAILIALDIGSKVASGTIEGATHGTAGKAAELATDVASMGASTLAKIGTYVVEKLSSYIVGAAAALFLLGVMLSVFIPMMPYVMWVGALVGLVILILEALVAIMLWAVMMMHPSGEGITSDYNRQGMNMLLALFMRPALLLMGLVLGMFMVEPLVMFVNDTFQTVITSVQANTFTGIFQMVAYISIYVSLILMIVDKSFSMIHVVPDRVLTWIGGAGALTGEERDAGQKGKEMIRGAGSALSSVMMGKSMGSSLAKKAVQAPKSRGPATGEK